MNATRTLDELAREAATCTRCRLAQGRTQVVFGVGHPDADLMFIGEAPGYYEDRQGEPFVGAAGQLLTQVLGEIGLRREQVYICNVLRCRPPGNRDPLPDEVEACTPWLEATLESVRPRVIVTLGNFATRFILGKPVSISRVRLFTRSAEQTRAVGEALASSLRSGDVVSLTGDLGAGKTTLVQGAARGLGVGDRVLSPTFTLVREYQGDVPIHHMDIYRLDRVQDVLDLGFEEMIDADGVVFVEWGDAIEGLLPEDHLQVELSIAEDGEARRIAVTGSGRGWESRWSRVEQSLRPFEEA